MNDKMPKPRRGRPPKAVYQNRDTKAALIRSGLEHLTETGFTASSIDVILKKVGVPKGSFYFYFSSKEAFGHEVMANYAQFFAKKLDKSLLDTSFSPLTRIANFVEGAKAGMATYDYKRGCLVGNLWQEVGLLPQGYREALLEILESWQHRIADCLREAQQVGELSKNADCEGLSVFFWTGWEGAVSRARLEKSDVPLNNYLAFFIKGLPA